jgi:hypothetical protein
LSGWLCLWSPGAEWCDVKRWTRAMSSRQQ